MQTTIHWFPGHMTKALRLMQAELKLVDLIWEIRDARLPLGSMNPALKEVIGNKKKIIILNKADLADSKEVTEWEKYFAKQGEKAFVLKAVDSKNVKVFLKEFLSFAKKEILKENKRQIKKALRVMIVGIPNVGKSSLINALDVNRQKAVKVGNKPGVTRGKQLIYINEDLELLDTPGVLWPKIECQETAWKLAAIGCIKDDVIDSRVVVESLVKWLLAFDQGAKLKERFNITDLPNEVSEILITVAQKRGFLLSGAKTDTERTVAMLLAEFRKGILGRYVLEKNL